MALVNRAIISAATDHASPPPSAAWYDAATAAQADGDVAHADAVTLRWTPVTLPAGNVTKLRFYKSTHTSNHSVKIGLYDAAGNLVASNGSGTLVTAVGTYEPVLAAPVAITAGAYKLAVIVDSNGGGTFGRYSGGVSPLRQSETGLPYYALPSTLPAPTFTSAQFLCLGAYIE